ncbi:hypothetical protein N780_15305 [Pontibacillus chungwhensis BH030062]|uniref:HNH nuclease domain-containing protein n=1 Tax=Pontibacillus chungwhensis BH030062 TaxID=1385513 RepID=A0A0A2UYY2_9BACI|nr:hypothetical protein [Pontibacillus chungwhensis]KGP91978.1 hypothetical protein N780_15305 [Pontibacillus chungwhensis BH030062]
MTKLHLYEIGTLNRYKFNSHDGFSHFKEGVEIKVDEYEIDLGDIRKKQQKHLPDVLETSEIDEENLQDELLKEIQSIQGSLERTTQAQDRIRRSAKLVRKLKTLYKHECQLCDPSEPFLPIIMETGVKYVEVHHITSIGLANTPEQKQDIESLDTYQNTVVVCPQHHMRLHFHQGGTDNLIKENNKLKFVFNNGETEELYLNYHLDEFDHSFL